MIKIPTNCPSCNSILELNKEQLFCRNNLCPAKNSKLLENFTSTLKIKGFGPRTLEKLELDSIEDLFLSAEVEGFYEALFGPTVGNKLLEELEQSKSKPLNDVLPALGIPLVGKTASSKICSVVNHISEITEATCKEAKLGPKVTSNLVEYITSRQWEVLPFSFVAVNREKASKGNVCISGKLSSFKTKALATEWIEELGYSVQNSVTKTTNYLINESGISSSKTVKADKLGIPILTNVYKLEGNK